MMTEEVQGEPLASVLFSQGGDLYQVPAMNMPIWLSVQAYPLLLGPGVANSFGPPVTAGVQGAYSLRPAGLAADHIYLGLAVTADGTAWRKAYSTGWKVILPGAIATLPASDSLVVDYAAAAGRSYSR